MSVTGRVLAGVLAVASVAVAVVLTLRFPPPLLAMVPLPDMYDLHVDFDTFWQSAVALLHGADIYDTPAKLTNLNPPLLTVLFAPFALLDVLTAYRVWVVLSVLLVLGATFAVCRELRVRPGPTALVLLAVAASSPLHGTLVLGQIYPLLLAGLVAGWIAHRRGRAGLGAVLVGITVALKPSLAPVLLLPAVQRQWAPLRAGLVGAAAATLAGVVIAGPTSGFEWLRIALTEPVPDTVDNASLPGLAVRLGLPGVLGLLLGAGVLIGTLWYCARHRDRIEPAGTAPWAVLAAALLCSPIAWHNYLMLLVPGLLLLAPLGRGAFTTVALAAAVVPVSWNAQWEPGTALAALGGSLYCAILLACWVALLSAASCSPASSDRSLVAAGSS